MRFVIFAPDYARNSGGIRALHILCDMLRKRNIEAVVAQARIFNPTLDTPPWDGKIRKHDYVIYPEIIQGNPYQAENVYRYILFPRAINEIKRTDEYIVFGKSFLAEASSIYHRTLTDYHLLYIPILRTELFNHEDMVENRDIVLTYHCKLNEEIANQVEITDTWPDSQEKLAELYKRAKYLVSYDRYTLITLEAQVCGCPTVTLQPEERQNVDFRNLGNATALTREAIEEARKVVMDQYDEYMNFINTIVPAQLDHFIKRTKAWDRKNGK